MSAISGERAFAARPTTSIGRDFPQLDPNIYLRQGEKGITILLATPNPYETENEFLIKKLNKIRQKSLGETRIGGSK